MPGFVVKKKEGGAFVTVTVTYRYTMNYIFKCYQNMRLLQ
jgi:hypothetical protein